MGLVGRKHIEKDAALARRFQSVLVQEPDLEDTISILRGLKEKYEVREGGGGRAETGTIECVGN